MHKKNEYLLSIGYKKCEKCENLFLQCAKEKICFECYAQLEEEKEEKMINLLKKNPFISETEAINLTKTSSDIYYKSRDILAQRVYNELIYFCEKTNLNIKDNEEYEKEYKKEAKFDFDKMIEMYINYEIGSKESEIFEISKKKLIKKIKSELNLRKLKKR